MQKCGAGSVVRVALIVAVAAGLSACSHAEAVTRSAETTGSVRTPAPVSPWRPMTREKASAECWMKFEKEGRGLSLDQRLPLVEKCTAEKLKGSG
jgi:hypothetical protein